MKTKPDDSGEEHLVRRQPLACGERLRRVTRILWFSVLIKANMILNSTSFSGAVKKERREEQPSSWTFLSGVY